MTLYKKTSQYVLTLRIVRFNIIDKNNTKRKGGGQLNKKVSGAKLMKLRGDKTRSLVANELEISESTLAMYESGHRTPRDEIKVRIANYYKKTVQEIFFEDQLHELHGKSHTA